MKIEDLDSVFQEAKKLSNNMIIRFRDGTTCYITSNDICEIVGESFVKIIAENLHTGKKENSFCNINEIKKIDLK